MGQFGTRRGRIEPLCDRRRIYSEPSLTLRITITGIRAQVVLQCKVSLEIHEKMNGELERNVPNRFWKDEVHACFERAMAGRIET